MSLINNLLKDLEKREALHQKVSHITLIHNKKHFRLFTFKKIIIFAFVLLTMVSCYLTYLIINKSRLQITLSKPLASIQKQHKNVGVINTPWLKPVVITGIHADVKENVTEISFQLDHPALYRLITNGNSFTLVFDQAELQTALPTVQDTYSAIEHFSFKKIGDEIHFIFDIHAGAVLQSIRVNDDNTPSSIHLFIDYQPAIPKVIEQKPVSLTKIPALETLLNQEYQAALTLAENNQYQQAIQKLESLLQTDPNYIDARVSLTALLMDQGDAYKAEQLLEQGLKLFPMHTALIELKARLLVNEGKTQSALNLLLSTLPSMVDNPDYHAFVAALYERTNNDLLAIKIYKQLLALNGENSNWWFGLGISLEKIGQKNGAKNAYSKALMLGNLNTDALEFLQQRLRSLQENQHAAK